MDYPLNLTKPSDTGTGFAVANSVDEHRDLSVSGFLPALDESETQELSDLDKLRAQLTEKGVTFDKRWGVARLTEELAKAE